MKKSKDTRKPDARRLQLDKEKLRELQPDQLSDVAGGNCCKSYGAPPRG